MWAWLAAAGAALLVAWTGYAVALSRGTVIVTPVWFAVLASIAAVLVVLAAVLLRRRGHRRVAAWVGALGCSLACYPAVAGLAATLAPSRPPGTEWLVALEGVWFIAPILLCGACCLVAAEEITGRRAEFQLGRRIPAGLAAMAGLIGLGVVQPAPYPGLAAPLARTPLGSPAAAAVFTVVMVAWMLSTALAPVLTVRAARRTSGLHRNRLTILAITGATPLLTLVSCLLLAAATGVGLLTESIAALVLSIVFCLPPILVAAGVAAASTARDDGVTGRIGLTARRALQALWIAVAAQLTALLASMVAMGTGTPSAVAASTIAVVLTVGFVAAYAPVAARVEAFMTLEPEPEPEQDDDRLAGILSPREREVLALIAEGRSNAAIATELFLSERTIDSHVRSIFDKLGLGREAGNNRRVQAAAAWIRAAAEVERQAG